MRKFIVLFVFVVFFCLVTVTLSQAGSEVDVLVETLVKKGYLTPLEAQIIQDEAKQAAAEDMAAGKDFGVPDWVQKMKVKGDVRVRYQYEKDQTDAKSRERGRVRFRLGLETKVTDEVKAGVGLASGGDDPRSTNQTFQDTFETGDMRLDYAYIEYMPEAFADAKMITGKFKRKPYLWAPTDMIWDGDVNPSGFALNSSGTIVADSGVDLLDHMDYLFNTGVWIMDEDSHTDNGFPFLYYTQAGVKYKDESIDGKMAGTYYAFNNVQNSCPQWTAGTNTGVTAGSSGACTGNLQYDYDSIGISAEVGAKELFGGLPYQIDNRIALFGDYVKNVSNSVEDDQGWAYGIKFGHKKVKKPGTWQLKYQRVILQPDAFLDTFPDSDRLGGKTNTKSHEIIAKYAVKKNVIFSVDYYQNDIYQGQEDKDHLVQADLLVKF